jgi:N-hydroxyarylamine O-acetyltransferase
MPYQQKLFDKYISLLGIELDEPSLEFLKRIVKAHLLRIPFENISKLLQKKQGANYIPDLSGYLEGIEKYNFGGTCYANNYYLYLLLKNTGYDVMLCGADMKMPDVHLVSIVSINARKYLVDAGYAAPFFEPMPVDSSEDFVTSFGVEKFVLRPGDENGLLKLEQYLNGELKNWYTLKPLQREINEFRKVIEDSYSDKAVFMNALRITRFTESGAFVLRNLHLTETVGSETTGRELTMEMIPVVVEEKFGIPAEKIAEAAGTIKKLKNIFD